MCPSYTSQYKTVVLSEKSSDIEHKNPLWDLKFSVILQTASVAEQIVRAGFLNSTNRFLQIFFEEYFDTKYSF
jgi:hypothetical protein